MKKSKLEIPEKSTEKTSKSQLPQNEDISSKKILDVNWNEVQTSIMDKQTKNFTIIYIVQAVLSALSLILIYQTYKYSQKVVTESNRPNLSLLVRYNEQNKATIVLYNAGPGVAYDVKYTVHLTNENGNIGKPYVKDVLRVAASMEVKNQDLIERYLASSSNAPIQNPPCVIAPGAEYNYSITNVWPSVLYGLIIILNYCDVSGNQYNTFIKGGNSKIGVGEYNYYPKYKFRDESDFPISRFYYILTSYDPRYNISDEGEWWERYWLEREADLLKDHGYPKALEMINKIKKMDQ